MLIALNFTLFKLNSVLCRQQNFVLYIGFTFNLPPPSVPSSNIAFVPEILFSLSKYRCRAEIQSASQQMHVLSGWLHPTSLNNNKYKLPILHRH